MKMAIDNTILRVITGSELYGTRVGEGLADRDEVGVCVEDPEYVFGLQNFEQYIYRDAVERWRREKDAGVLDAMRGDGKHVKSQPGDLDLTIYGLRKFMKMAVNCNPSAILLFFAPRHAQIVQTPLGAEMQALGPSLACKKAGACFAGFMNDQLKRLMGERGQRDINRPELVERFGFDTKYAGHVIRLALQGIELMQTGQLTLPMVESNRALVVDVRNGKYTLEQVIDLANELSAALTISIDQTRLPKLPDYHAVDRFLQSAYPRYWSASENARSAA